MTKTVSRRAALKAGGILGILAAAGFILPKAAFAAWNKDAFEGKTVADALKALGAQSATESGDIQFLASDIAENGAVVPVQVISKIPNTEQIAVLVDKNPSPLAALFTLPAGTEPDVATRVKMGQTSNVIALVKSGDKYFTATKEIKVTLGGCGG